MSFNSMEIWVNVQNGRGPEGKQELWLGTDREYFSRMSPLYCWKHVRGLHGLITVQRYSSWSPLPHLLFCLKKPTFFLPHTTLSSTFSPNPHSVRSPEWRFTQMVTSVLFLRRCNYLSNTGWWLPCHFSQVQDKIHWLDFILCVVLVLFKIISMPVEFSCASFFVGWR